MIPYPQQNDFKTAKEAIVLVKLNASPWYNTICPYCKHPVSSAWKFCADCGQAISFNNFSRIIRAGYKRINLTEEWKECVVDNNLCKDYFIQQLAILEDDCLVEPGKDFNEAREAYLKACFKGPFPSSASTVLETDVALEDLADALAISELKDMLDYRLAKIKKDQESRP